MNSPIFHRTPTGYDGKGTIHVGRSYVHFDGHVDQAEVAALQEQLAKVGALVERYGSIDTSGVDLGTMVSQGLGAVSQVANSPVGTAVEAYAGPYGILAVEAAKGAGPAVAALQKQLGPPAQTAAQLTHHDPKVRAQAKGVVDRILRDDAAGNPKARVARLDLTVAVLKLRTLQLKECQAKCDELRDRLAAYGDPAAWSNTAGPGPSPIALLERGPQITVDRAALATFSTMIDRALTRARTNPQPGFLHLKKPG